MFVTIYVCVYAMDVKQLSNSKQSMEDNASMFSCISRFLSNLFNAPRLPSNRSFVSGYTILFSDRLFVVLVCFPHIIYFFDTFYWFSPFPVLASFWFILIMACDYLL